MLPHLRQGTKRCWQEEINTKQLSGKYILSLFFYFHSIFFPSLSFHPKKSRSFLSHLNFLKITRLRKKMRVHFLKTNIFAVVYFDCWRDIFSNERQKTFFCSFCDWKFSEDALKYWFNFPSLKLQLPNFFKTPLFFSLHFLSFILSPHRTLENVQKVVLKKKKNNNKESVKITLPLVNTCPSTSSSSTYPRPLN